MGSLRGYPYVDTMGMPRVVVVTSAAVAIDLITPSGRALAGMHAVFAEFEREIIRD